MRFGHSSHDRFSINKRSAHKQGTQSDDRIFNNASQHMHQIQNRRVLGLQTGGHSPLRAEIVSKNAHRRSNSGSQELLRGFSGLAAVTKNRS